MLFLATFYFYNLSFVYDYTTIITWCGGQNNGFCVGLRGFFRWPGGRPGEGGGCRNVGKTARYWLWEIFLFLGGRLAVLPTFLS